MRAVFFVGGSRFRLLIRLSLLRTEVGGKACEGFGWWGKALTGAGGGSFELCGGEDAQSAGVAGG